MDIEKWYPNILSKQSAKKVRKMWEESKLLIDEIDVDHLARYLGKHLKLEEVIEEAFGEIIYTKEVKAKKNKVTKKIGKKQVKNNPKKKQKKSKKVFNDNVNNSSKGDDTLIAIDETVQNENEMDMVINTSEGQDTLNAIVEEKIYTSVQLENEMDMDTNTSKGHDTLNASIVPKKKSKKSQVWKKPMRKPTQVEERQMFGKALEIMLVTCMENHLYQFNGTVRIQNKGGPIGLKLTGEIADCIMIDWDKILLAKLEKLGLVPEIYTRFKDDIQIVNETLEKGTKIKEGRLVIDNEKKELDTNKNGDQITIEVIQEVANSIDPIIKLTVETPSNFEDRKLPVLDVKVGINENNRIDFEFYEKPTRNPRVILMDSALSHAQKRTILTQECLRRLRNTKVEMGPEVQKKHLDKFMMKLKNSGYDQKFRTEILDSALKAFEKIKEEDKNQIKPMYRDRTWHSEERKVNKEERKHNWWNSK